MKKTGILHSELSRHLAALGHTDQFLIVDSGFPVPPSVPVVDLRLVYGIPRFQQVLDAVLAEVAVEAAVVARELPGANPGTWRVVEEALHDVEQVGHDELKARATGARFGVRTGEDTPYSNVLLTAGVAFEV